MNKVQGIKLNKIFSNSSKVHLLNNLPGLPAMSFSLRAVLFYKNGIAAISNKTRR